MDRTRARVTSTLTWSDLIAGTHASVRVVWTYTDGSTSSTLPEPVQRDRVPSRDINLTSSSTKQVVVSVSVAVFSNVAGYDSVGFRQRRTVRRREHRPVTE